MPRNDQVTRQWHILRHLEASHAGLTLQALLEALPDGFPNHPRTIRRDLEALEVAGFPIVSDRIDGHVRWRLMDGFRNVPALAFSPTELMALVMSRVLLKPLEGTQVQTALDSALNKASKALPSSSVDYVRQVQGIFSVGLGPHKRYKQQRETIDRLSHAIAQQKTIQIRYDSASRGRVTRREIDPYRLWYASGGLYLIGHCHVRREPRMFAVERVRAVTLTDHPYQIPLHFDLEAFVQDAFTVMRGPRIDVELLFNKMTAAWAKDRVWHPSQQIVQFRDGRMKMTITVADTRELVGWVLSFGSGVKVIAPKSLQAAVTDEAKKIIGYWAE